MVRSAANYIQADVGGWHQRSTVTVTVTRTETPQGVWDDSSAILVQVTHTWDDDALANFAATVQATLPYVIAAQTYAVTGTFSSFFDVGTSDRTDTYVTSVPFGVADSVVASSGDDIDFFDSLCTVAGNDCISQIEQP